MHDRGAENYLWCRGGCGSDVGRDLKAACMVLLKDF